MKLLTLDFETYWDRDGYTLSKMPTEEYVRDPRFKAHGVGLQMGDGEPVYVQEGQINAIFSKIDWADTAVLCQNTAFDGFILEERYGVRPKMYLDTMSMFRFLYPNRRASLATICKTFGLPDKGNEVSNTSGIRDLTPEQQRRLGEYCKDDVRFTYAAFNLMKGSIPTKELKIIDLTIRWAVRAVLRLNTGLLQEALAEEIEAKRLLLEKIEADKTTLSSALLFAELLRSLGVTPPIKISPTALKKDKGLADMADSIRQEDGLLTIAACEAAGIPWTYAFGKADKEFKILADHDDPMISAVVQARLGVKSTLKETRTERLINISKRGALPVPLLYYGAATGRWSACLVAETEIIVYDWSQGITKKHITHVLPDDLVWDGITFVEHEGVQFSGFREVIYYDGIKGTPEHEVFITDAQTTTLSGAMQGGQRIMEAREPTYRDVENYFRGIQR